MRIWKEWLVWIAVWGSLLCSASHGAALDGRVVSVYDGDTIGVLAKDGRSVKVRLYGIDAPESGQPYGVRAKQRLAELVFGRTVRIETHGQDGYGRVLGVVYLDGKDINAQMVTEGLAWAYVRYSKRYAPHQRQAMAARRQLWSDSHPTPPWDWRRGERPVSDDVVYVTTKGKHYHREGCAHLKSGATRLSLPDAQRQGYTACRVCFPR